MDIKDGELPTIDIYTLSYNNTKELVETPTDPIGINLKKHVLFHQKGLQKLITKI